MCVSVGVFHEKLFAGNFIQSQGLHMCLILHTKCVKKPSVVEILVPIDSLPIKLLSAAAVRVMHSSC
jgi:hypothetical protein